MQGRRPRARLGPMTDDDPDGLCDFDFLDDVPADLLCGVCQEVSRDPVVTEECGHLFCEACLAKAAGLSPLCPICRYDKYTTRKDHRAKRQVDGLRVRCNYRACAWEGAYNDVFKHQALCERRPVFCAYREWGCREPLDEDPVVHEGTRAAAHLQLVSAEVRRLQKCVATLVEREAAAHRDRAALWEELTATREALKHERDENAALRRLRESEFEALRDELLTLRLHMNSNAPPLPAAGLAWGLPAASPGAQHAFAISDNGRRATLAVPGWSTVRCSHGFSSGRRCWFVRLASDDASFEPSTVMVGVTANCHTTGIHIGNVPEARCFQTNGYRWDGSQCFAYGAVCRLNDVVGVHLDFAARTLRFSRNGQCMGTAFTDVGGLLYPAVSVCSKGHAAIIEQGENETLQ